MTVKKDNAVTVQTSTDIALTSAEADKRHINGQTGCLEHTIEVRECLAKGYIDWSEVNLEISAYCLGAENELPL